MEEEDTLCEVVKPYVEEFLDETLQTVQNTVDIIPDSLANICHLFGDE